jgi:hypothetical protein
MGSRELRCSNQSRRTAPKGNWPNGRRSHVTHEHVDNLSRDQIVEQLQEFMERAKNRMIDVTPTENPTESEQIPITDCSGEAAE